MDSPRFLSRYGPLAVAAALIGGGAIELSKDNNPVAGALLAAAGLITFGAWLTIEIYHTFHHDHSHEHEEK